MHVIIKFLNNDGYEVETERYLFCPINVDRILVSVYSGRDMLVDSCKLEVTK